MTTRLSTSILGVILLTCSAAPQPSAARFPPDPLGIRLHDVPLDFQQMPLTQALGWIGFAAEPDFVLFGAEVQTTHGREPLVSAHIEGGKTVREAIIELTAQLPEYTFEGISGHLINVFPAAARNDARDLLNLSVSDLDVVKTVPSNFLANPARYVPELRLALNGGVLRGCAIGPGLSDEGAEADMHLTGHTLREDLNQASELTIAMAEDGRGAAYGWLYLHDSTPPGANTWRVLGVWRRPVRPSPNAR